MKTTTAAATPMTIIAEDCLRQAPVLNVAAVGARLDDVTLAMLRESWLPIGLRTLIVHNLPMLRIGLERPKPRVRQVSRSLSEIVRTSADYGTRVFKSDTVRLLRALEDSLRDSAEAA